MLLAACCYSSFAEVHHEALLPPTGVTCAKCSQFMTDNRKRHWLSALLLQLS
jgi:hypothetical protein